MAKKKFLKNMYLYGESWKNILKIKKKYSFLWRDEKNVRGPAKNVAKKIQDYAFL